MAIRGRAFLAAAGNGHLRVLHLILGDTRVDLAMYGGAALIHAVRHGRSDAVELLLPKCPEVDCNGLFREAVAAGHVGLVDLLLANPKVDPNHFAWHSNCLTDAALRGHAAVVRRLLADPRVDPRALGGSAFAAAVMKGHIAVVDAMLADPRTDPMESRSSSFSPLVLACRAGMHALVNRLLQDRRVDPSADNQAAVRAAAEQGDLVALELLLSDARVDPQFALRTVSLMHWAAPSKEAMLVSWNAFFLIRASPQLSAMLPLPWPREVDRSP